jgi:pimeloyl-ACP methyl ester carboxylesterase
MKKVFKIIGIFFMIIIAAIVLFFGSVYVVNKISIKSESKKIEDYGQKVEVDGKKMNVQVTGEGADTVVLLPGYLTASPVIDFSQLITELSKTHRVVAIEPFGYGLSDDINKERTIDNMTTEIHEVLQALDIDRYTLMGHSISGIYGLDYINKYANEVQAFVGIDSSIPAQGGAEDTQSKSLKFLSKSGLYRLLAKLVPEAIIYPEVTDKVKDQYKMISLKNLGNQSTLSEAKNMEENFEVAAKINYPKELPILFILAEGSLKDTKGWLEMHQEIVKNSDYSKIEIYKGEHYLHHTKSKEIAAEFDKFIKNHSGN